MEILPEPLLTRRSGPVRTYGGNSAFHNFYNDYSHIADPNLRRRLALSEIDKVPFGLYRRSLSESPERLGKQTGNHVENPTLHFSPS